MIQRLPILMGKELLLSFIKLAPASNILPLNFLSMKLTVIFFVAHPQEIGTQFTLSIEEGKRGEHALTDSLSLNFQSSKSLV